MKMINKFYLISCIILFNFTCFSRELKDFDSFWAVLTKLESNNDPRAIGDNNLAIGIAQIHKNYFLDAQEYDKNLLKYKYSDCFNPQISKLVVKAYLSKYCVGNDKNDFESWARCHNSGWNWKNKKELTNKYWARFVKIQNS